MWITKLFRIQLLSGWETYRNLEASALAVLGMELVAFTESEEGMLRKHCSVSFPTSPVLLKYSWDMG